MKKRLRALHTALPSGEKGEHASELMKTLNQYPNMKIGTELELFDRIGVSTGVRVDRRVRRPPHSTRSGLGSRGSEQVEVRVTQVVKRPAAGNDHCIGMSEAENAAIAGGPIEPVEPEHQIFGAHAISDRRGV